MNNRNVFSGSSRFLVALLSASLPLLCGAPTHAQTTTATLPVGFMTYTLTGGGFNNAVGVPLLDTEVFSGPSSTIGANTIAVSTTPWTAGAFATAAAPYFVTVLSGTQTGRTLLVTANTTNTLTVAVDDTVLNASGFAMAAGDRFEITPGETIATFFGATAPNLLLTGATVPYQADSVQIHNGTKFVSYFFNTTLGYWVMLNGGTTDYSSTVLYPDRAVMVLRRGATTAFTVTGRVPSTARLTKLPGGSTNAITTRFPTDTTLGTLSFSGPGTWVTNASSSLASNVSIWNGVKWVGYWQESVNGPWRQVNGDGTDTSATVIAAGTPLLIVNRSAGTGSVSFYSQALPYSLN